MPFRAKLPKHIRDKAKHARAGCCFFPFQIRGGEEPPQRQCWKKLPAEAEGDFNKKKKKTRRGEQAVWIPYCPCTARVSGTQATRRPPPRCCTSRRTRPGSPAPRPRSAPSRTFFCRERERERDRDRARGRENVCVCVCVCVDVFLLSTFLECFFCCAIVVCRFSFSAFLQSFTVVCLFPLSTFLRGLVVVVVVVVL